MLGFVMGPVALDVCYRPDVVLLHALAWASFMGKGDTSAQLSWKAVLHPFYNQKEVFSSSVFYL